MSGANEQLLQHYGTEKAASLLAGLVAAGLVGNAQKEDKAIAARQAAEAAAAEELELLRMAQANAALRHTDVPFIPSGYDSGMVRLAMIAVAAGQDMAKEAGIGSIASGVLPAIKDFGSKASGFLGKAVPAAEKTLVSAGQQAPGMLGQAKSKLLGPLGVKGNLALIGGTLGAGYLMNKGVHAATGALGRPGPAGARVYGNGGFGYNPPATVNDWGVPQ